MLVTLKNMILQEHSKQQCDKIVQYIGRDKERFAELMVIFFGNETRLSQRAAWPLSYVVRRYPSMIDAYLNKLIANLSRKDLHDAILRNSVRLLQDVQVPVKYHGKLMDTCFNFIASPTTAVAIKAFSLTILQQLSGMYPEIIPELKVIVDERWEHETAAFHSRARKIFKELK